MKSASPSIAIVIPARYASTRFPGKPLALIHGKSMLSHVVAIARNAAAKYDHISVMVATEDERIKEHCKDIGAECVITSDQCKTGSDRVLEAIKTTNHTAEFIIGLQGDAPGTPVSAITNMIELASNDPSLPVITPVINLRWDELDALRAAKDITPFTGTTATIDKNGKALWFSKNIIPAIRKEDALRIDSHYSPVHQHLGLYGFRRNILENFVALPQGHYEKLEGLEQLRLLENNIDIQTYTLDVDIGMAQAGVDSPEDIARIEKLLVNEC